MQRKYAEAESELQLALTLCEELVKLTDNSPQARYDLAATQYERSVVLSNLTVWTSPRKRPAHRSHRHDAGQEFPRVTDMSKGLEITESARRCA